MAKRTYPLTFKIHYHEPSANHPKIKRRIQLTVPNRLAQAEYKTWAHHFAHALAHGLLHVSPLPKSVGELVEGEVRKKHVERYRNRLEMKESGKKWMLCFEEHELPKPGISTHEFLRKVFLAVRRFHLNDNDNLLLYFNNQRAHFQD